MDVQVLEGSDNTARPVLKTWEFDKLGRKQLDECAADGKPTLSHKVLSRARSAKMFFCAAIPLLYCLIDHGEHDNAMTMVQRPLKAWWRTFWTLDTADVTKGRTVRFPELWGEEGPFGRGPLFPR